MIDYLAILSPIPLLAGQIYLWRGRNRPLLVMMAALGLAVIVYLVVDPKCENCDAASRGVAESFFPFVTTAVLVLNAVIAAAILLFRPRAERSAWADSEGYLEND